MKILVLFCLLITDVALGQDIGSKLSKAIEKLELEAQFKHSILSLYIVDGKMGNVIYEKNSEVGLAPASCQKIITSVTAFEILGRNYRYNTSLAYKGIIEDAHLTGDIYILGSGDPTLGSWRYPSTQESVLLTEFASACKSIASKGITGGIISNEFSRGPQVTPDGWIWQDIGNYYGAGASVLNWRENQFDIVLKSGKSIGDPVTIIGTTPLKVYGLKFTNGLTSAAKGSGDNAYIYLAPGSFNGYLLGTIPINEDHFTISGSYPDPAGLLRHTLAEKLTLVNAGTNSGYGSTQNVDATNTTLSSFTPTPSPDINAKDFHNFYTHSSPPLDSINYWFLKKSVNLYGEALLKTIAFKQTLVGSTDSGVSVIRAFWSAHNIERSSLKILDGSGLSPANRVTTKAFVRVLQYARNKDWFPSFYYDLPEINGIKMKDGYINGVRSYSGYIKAANGSDYIFSFIINNFDGNPVTVKEKMWQILNILK